MAVGGIGEALGGLGTAIMSALPELLIVVGVLAAIAAVIGGIAWFVSNRKNQNRETHVAKDIGSEIDKGISDGVKALTSPQHLSHRCCSTPAGSTRRGSRTGPPSATSRGRGGSCGGGRRSRGPARTACP